MSVLHPMTHDGTARRSPDSRTFDARTLAGPQPFRQPGSSSAL
jgi:hypothetical protein